jgi:3-oxoadipate enol-lactonase
VLGASLGGMIAQEFAVRHPDRVRGLVLACTTPGWPFAYPMPLPSVRLIAASQRLAPDEALRRHVENALSASTVAERPELVQRIIDCQPSISSRDPDAWQAQAAAGGRYAGSFRQRRIRARTLVLHGTDPTRRGTLSYSRSSGPRSLASPKMTSTSPACN